MASENYKRGMKRKAASDESRKNQRDEGYYVEDPDVLQSLDCFPLACHKPDEGKFTTSVWYVVKFALVTPEGNVQLWKTVNNHFNEPAILETTLTSEEFIQILVNANKIDTCLQKPTLQDEVVLSQNEKGTQKLALTFARTKNGINTPYIKIAQYVKLDVSRTSNVWTCLSQGSFYFNQQEWNRVRQMLPIINQRVKTNETSIETEMPPQAARKKNLIEINTV
jgi:hypothetical protein